LKDDDNFGLVLKLEIISYYRVIIIISWKDFGFFVLEDVFFGRLLVFCIGEIFLSFHKFFFFFFFFCLKIPFLM
jgi:hypothetical protein